MSRRKKVRPRPEITTEQMEAIRALIQEIEYNNEKEKDFVEPSVVLNIYDKGEGKYFLMLRYDPRDSIAANDVIDKVDAIIKGTYKQNTLRGGPVKEYEQTISERSDRILAELMVENWDNGTLEDRFN